MNSKTTKSFAGAIVVHPSDLKYLDEYLSRSFSEVTYLATCEDGTKLKPKDLEELLNYENPSFKRLATLSVLAGGENYRDDNIEIVMGKPVYLSSKTVDVEFEFEDINQQYAFEKEIINRVKLLRPWYFWLSPIEWRFLLPALLFVSMLAYPFMTLMQKLRGIRVVEKPPQVKFSENVSVILLFLMIGVLFLVGYAVDNSRNFLFPKYFFVIGRQKEVYEKRRNIANVVFVVIILGIIINILSSFIVQPLSK